MWKENRPLDAEGFPAQFGNCPPGYRIDKDRCFQCFPGSYTSGQDSRCFLCPKNFYMPKFSATLCWLCPNERITLDYGSQSEDDCIQSNETAFYNSTHLMIIFACIVPIITAFMILATALDFLFGLNIGKRLAEKKARRDDKVIVFKKTKSAEGHIYESISSISSDGENIYSNIDDSHDSLYESIIDGNDENYYETPIHASKPAYLELIPESPPEGNMKRIQSDGDFMKGLMLPNTSFNPQYYFLTNLPEAHYLEAIGDMQLQGTSNREVGVETIESVGISMNFNNSPSSGCQLKQCINEFQSKELSTSPGSSSISNFKNSPRNRSPSPSLVDVVSSSSEEYCIPNTHPKIGPLSHHSSEAVFPSPTTTVKNLLEPMFSAPPPPPPSKSLSKLNSTVSKKSGDKSEEFY